MQDIVKGVHVIVIDLDHFLVSHAHFSIVVAA